MLFCDQAIPRSAASGNFPYFAIKPRIFLLGRFGKGVILGLELIGTYNFVQ
jgi:hypothetical protein